jgi:hypothetical protein
MTHPDLPADDIVARLDWTRGMPSQTRPLTLAQLVAPPLGALGVLVVLASLSGCAAISDALSHQHSETFDNYAAAKKGWVGVDIPSWIPEDASAIDTIATTNEIDAVIRVTSDTGLPTSCTDVDRVGLPFTSGGSIPKLDSLPDRVSRCGDYEVIAVTGGWLGWYNGVKSGDKPTPGL